jgi:integrase
MNYGRMGENPVRSVAIPSDVDAVRIHVLSLGEERIYFHSANGDLRDCALMILNQGMRPEEVLSLGKTDVDLERGVLHIRRGKSKAARRTLRLTEEVRSVIARRIVGASPWIFPSPKKPGRHIVKLTDRTTACA